MDDYGRGVYESAWPVGHTCPSLCPAPTLNMKTAEILVEGEPGGVTGDERGGRSSWEGTSEHAGGDTWENWLGEVQWNEGCDQGERAGHAEWIQRVRGGNRRVLKPAWLHRTAGTISLSI